MIKKILIANRGEIALRIIKTCSRLGLKTVAIASESEKGHPHLLHADESIILEREFPSEVYLDSKLIIETALKHKADAIHPGYGFLAENSDFSAKTTKAGLIFIGPSKTTLDLLGDKARTRILAIENKVPVVPGYNGEDQNEEELLKQAKKIGFPLLLKAVMGGGGRGMRKVENQKIFLDALHSAKEESKRLYSNTDICIEKFISEPRHIEVQVAGDLHENYLHFFERDCSIQRRFQKVIEFAPSNLNSKVTNKLYEYALKIAKASKLTGIATMEFLVSEGQIYFLEANPRIQVEHPVTETICQVDLVETQIKIANGKSIEEIKPKKYLFALEARIYAESPEKNFINTSGHIRNSNLPDFNRSFELNENVRHDHALFKNFEINQYFDPMLSKLIVSASDHKSLLKCAIRELKNISLLGIETNIPLLISLLDEPNFHEFSAQELDKYQASYPSAEIAALCAHLLDSDSKISAFSNSWQVNLARKSNYYIDNNKFEVSKISDTTYLVNDKKLQVETCKLDIAIINKSEFSIRHFSPIHSENIEILINGKLFNISRTKSKLNELENFDYLLKSPLPGKITKILVKKGQKIYQGETLVCIESMKIEHSLKCAAIEGEIEEVFVSEGDNVNSNQVLLKTK